MKINIISFALVFFVFSIPQFQCFAQQDEVKNEDVCKILGVVISNSKAIVKGDVLVRELATFDTTPENPDELPPGIFAKYDTYIRVIFDHTKEQFAVFRVRISSIHDFDTGQDQEKVDIFAACFAGEETIHRFGGGHPYTQSRSDYPPKKIKFLQRLGFRDFRTFWFARGTPKSIDEDDMATIFARKQGRWFHSSQKIGENELAIKFKRSGLKVLGKQYELHVDYQFDIFNSLPLSTEKYYADKSKPRMLQWSKKIAWKEISNVFVPSVASSRELDSVLVGDKEHHGYRETEYEFHWFSVNEDFKDKKYFDGTYTKNEQTVVDMVDPEKTGATSLLDSESSSETDDENGETEK